MRRGLADPSELDLILGTVAFAFDTHGLGVVQLPAPSVCPESRVRVSRYFMQQSVQVERALGQL